MKFVSGFMVLFFLLWSYIPTLIFLGFWSWLSVKFYKLFLCPLTPMDVLEIQERQRERDDCKASISEMWNMITENEDENAPNPIDQIQETATNTWNNVSKVAQDIMSKPSSEIVGTVSSVVNNAAHKMEPLVKETKSKVNAMMQQQTQQFKSFLKQ